MGKCNRELVNWSLLALANIWMKIEASLTCLQGLGTRNFCTLVWRITLIMINDNQLLERILGLVKKIKYDL
jgi:wyosine [tRNA(Phe)-imidazoG37] synthetase (radical SAM superfamily)